MELDPKTVRKALGGDREAFQGIVERLWGPVFLYIRQRIHEAERARDLTQETFLQAYDKRKTLRRGKSFVSWIFTIASNKIIDSYRRSSLRPSLLGEARDLPIEDPGPDPTAGVEAAENEELLRDALAQLGDRYRAVVILRYWSGMSPAQIARLLQEPEGTIRNRIFRAHMKLRALLERPVPGRERTLSLFDGDAEDTKP